MPIQRRMVCVEERVTRKALHYRSGQGSESGWTVMLGSVKGTRKSHLAVKELVRRDIRLGPLDIYLKNHEKKLIGPWENLGNSCHDAIPVKQAASNWLRNKV
jgi:hypothetical protein